VRNPYVSWAFLFIQDVVAYSKNYWQGRSDGGGYRYLYPPPKKSAQVNFLWGKNDVRTAIQQFYTPPKKKIYTPKNKFLATPLITGPISTIDGSYYDAVSRKEVPFWRLEHEQSQAER